MSYRSDEVPGNVVVESPSVCFQLMARRHLHGGDGGMIAHVCPFPGFVDTVGQHLPSKMTPLV